MAEAGIKFTKRKPLRGTAWYECDECGNEWKMRNSKGGPKTCDDPDCHKEEIEPYKFEPDPWKKGQPTEWRLFGDFRCARCGRTWPSANTWIEWNPISNEWQKYWQACKSCPKNEANKVYPLRIRPLKHSGDRNRKEHLSQYCEKCKKLGRNCRTYVPLSKSADVGDDDEEEDEEDDDVSVMSAVSNVDINDLDGVPTPVPSDEETTEEFLIGKIGDLALSGKK